MRGSRGESWNRGGWCTAGVTALVLSISVTAAKAQIEECDGEDPILDCDGNNVDDFCDIAFGTYPDSNSNGIPDSCDTDICYTTLWGGFQPDPPWAVSTPAHEVDFDGDGDQWDNPSGSWTVGNGGCVSNPGESLKSLKGAVSDPPTPPAYVTSEFFHTNAEGLLECTSAKYTFTADFRSEAQLNPRVDWQISIHTSTARTNLKDPTNDPAVILIHFASTQSGFAGVTQALGGTGRGRILVQNPAGSPAFINTGHRILANTCFRISVELDNNAPAAQAVKITVGTQPPVIIARLASDAYRMDYFYIKQVSNTQPAGGLNRLALDNVTVCESGPATGWDDCNIDCVDDLVNIALSPGSVQRSPNCNGGLVPDECDHRTNCSCEDTPVSYHNCIWCNHKHIWKFETTDTDPQTEEIFTAGPLQPVVPATAKAPAGQRGWETLSLTDTADVQVVPCAGPPNPNYCTAGGCTDPSQPCFSGNIVKLGKLGFGEAAEGAAGPRTRLASVADADIEFWEADVLLDAQDQQGQIYFVVWDRCSGANSATPEPQPTRFDGTEFTAGVQFHTDSGNNRTVRLLDGTPPDTVWRDQGLNRSWSINQKKHINIKINNTTGQVEYYAGVHTQGMRDPLRMYTLANENPAAGGDTQVLLLSTSKFNDTSPGINSYWDSLKYSKDNNCDRDDLPDSLWLAGTCWDNGVPPPEPNGEFYLSCYDLNNNCLLDWCEDCNDNGTLDSVEITAGSAKDCNANGIPDLCDVDPTQPRYREFGDAPNGGCIPGDNPSFWDFYSRRGGGSFDCNANNTPDDCEADCNANRLADDCDIAEGTSKDLGGPTACSPDAIPDECQADCNTNGIHDRCDIATNGLLDCNINGVMDACDLEGNDCNNSLTPDDCELVNNDCDTNGTPDECDAAGNDCNVNGIPDVPCEVNENTDCQPNGILDSCDIAGGTSQDANSNGTPDECVLNLLSAVSRKANISGPGGVCDLPIDLDSISALITSDMRVDPNDISNSRGITQVMLTFDGPPGAAATIEQDITCPSPPVYAAYTGNSVVNCTPSGNVLTCTFAPGLENVRTYRLTVGSAQVEIRGLLGDTNSDGRVNSTDRSTVVGFWTTIPGFTCLTDINNDGRTNSADRSSVVGFWTSALTNCAP